MKFIAALAAAVALMHASGAAAEQCAVPASLIASDSGLARVAGEMRQHRRLDISVIGTGSSTLPGPQGPGFAYPARLQLALQQLLPGVQVRLVVHIRPRQTAAQMAAGMKKIMADDKPMLVIWQTGTFDAVSGVDLDAFSASLDDGIDAIIAAGADVDLLNMQYNPRLESLLDVSDYADTMQRVAQERGALLFDRLAIMRYWNDVGSFDLYAATKTSDMARRVHNCVGRALASQIVDAVHPIP
jgi:hypothetical protein